MTADRMAWLSLGGNVGNVEGTFARVRRNLESTSVGAVNSSSIYRTQPWGRIDQPDFLNQVIGFVPKDGLEETHLLLQHLERAEGRLRTQHWGPRTVDIDILYWPNRQCSNERLMVPHPRLHERRFVLEPWVTIAPSLFIPGYGKTVEELLDECTDSSWLEKLQ